MKTRWFLSSLVILMSACTHGSSETKIYVPPAPLEDSDYAATFNSWYRTESVVEQLRKQLDIHAVMLSLPLRGAWADRFVRMRGKTEAPFNGKDLPWGFLVSISSPERAYEHLDNAKLWTILIGKDGVYTQAKVEPLSEKSMLSAFLPFIDLWTKDFLITPVEGNSTQEKATLVFRSALTNLELKW